MKRNPTRRPLRGLVLGLLIVVFSLAILSVPWRGTRPHAGPAVTAAVGAGPLSAGVAARLLELGPDPTIAGFPRLRWRAAGVRDPVSVRALVLAEQGCSVALASVELLVVPGALTRAVGERVADLGLDAIVIGATHTHAGPGGYWDSLPGELGATGPYRPAAFDRLAADVAQAIREAHATRRPAAVSVARDRTEALTRNRTGAAVDGRLLALRVTGVAGEPLAELVVFAAHPTLLGSENRLISGGFPGRLLATSPRGTRLFFQGALGDQSATPRHLPGVDPVVGYAADLGLLVDGLAPGPADPAPRLSVASATVRLPPISPGALPGALRPAAYTALGGTFPERATVTALRLGAALLLFAPAEPVEEVGRSWRAMAGPDAEVISLAGDYLGYVDTAARFEAGTGEARRSYYGAELPVRLDAAVRAAALAAETGSIR